MISLIKQIYLVICAVIIAWSNSVVGFEMECTNKNNMSALNFKYASYNQIVECQSSQKLVAPATIVEIQEVVKSALRNRLTVKPLGNLHSATDIICTDGIPLSLSNINHLIYYSSTGLVTVGAGATLEYLLESLHKFNRTINGIPTYSEITIGGAIGTGAHGTNLRGYANLSDDIVSLVVIDGLGHIQNISDTNGLRAFGAHLGLLGVVYEVTLSTIPQYKLHIKNYPQHDSVLWKGNTIRRLAKSTDRFQFFWFPTSRQVVMSVGNRVPISTPGNCKTNFISGVPPRLNEQISKAFEQMQEDKNHLGYFVMQQTMKLSLFHRTPIRSPLYSSKNTNTMCNPAIGFSHRMTVNKCNECVWNNKGHGSIIPFEMAVIIPLSELEGAIHTMKNILDRYPAEFPLSGIYFRLLAESDGLLAVNSGRASLAIEWIVVSRTDRFTKPALGLSVYQALFQALIFEHQGRPHWGKNGLVYTQQQLLLKSYPELPTFVKQMEEFDPKGVFVNDFGRRLRFGCTKTSMDSNVEHCALVDNCFCSKDEDCGDGKSDSNFCGQLQGYNVCRERIQNYRQRRGRAMRNIIRKLVSMQPNLAALRRH